MAQKAWVGVRWGRQDPEIALVCAWWAAHSVKGYTPTTSAHQNSPKKTREQSLVKMMGGGLVGRNEKCAGMRIFADSMAEWTGLEPATPGVTGRYSNQLNYHSW